MKHVAKHSAPAPAGKRAISPRNSFVARHARGLGIGAAGLLTSALVNQVNRRRAEAKTPPAGAFIEVDGTRLHYVDRGAGPAVVLLHGNGVMLQDFEASGVLGLAAAKNRVIAFDRPGFGYSSRPRSTAWTPAAQADLIARALAQLSVEQAVVLGHSWGAMVALAMALDHPALVSGLVLLSGYYYPTARPDILLASLSALPVAGDLIAMTVSPLLGLATGPAALKFSFAPAPVSNNMADFPMGLALRPSQMRAAAAEGAMMVPAAIGLARRYGELTLPVIIMAGEGDLITHAAKHAERLAGELSRAELRMVPDQGHFLHYDVPEQVVASVSALTARSSKHH
jgi:pimeloyl-ACP methyl ester carboxylesterase